MSAITYLKGASTKITEHFKVSEFDCSCSSCSTTKVSTELCEMLEDLRSELDCSKIIISSGYRCEDHNAEVGGSETSKHVSGEAADVICYDEDGNIISSKIVCCTAQDLGFPGIANVDEDYTITHLDVRSSGTYYGDETVGYNSVTDDFHIYFGLVDDTDDATLEKAEEALSEAVKASATGTASTRTDLDVDGDGDVDITDATQILQEYADSAADGGDSVYTGIDVSKHQGTINWQSVASDDSVQFAIIRAGYGRESNQIDAQFENNYQGCKDNGIPCGAYWYSYADDADAAKKEATQCLAALDGKSFEYPIAYDMEESDTLADADAIAEAFCSALEDAGYYVVIYSYKSALEECFSSSTFDKYDTWVAHIGVDETTYKGSYGLWQYSWTGSVSGIDADVDLDKAYKDYPTIMKKNGLNGY